MSNSEEWFLPENPPKKVGWYMCELKNGDKIKAPFARTLSGSLVWVIPDASQIVKWTNS